MCHFPCPSLVVSLSCLSSCMTHHRLHISKKYLKLRKRQNKERKKKKREEKLRKKGKIPSNSGFMNLGRFGGKKKKAGSQCFYNFMGCSP